MPVKNRRVFWGPSQTWANVETGEQLEVLQSTLVGGDSHFEKFWIGTILELCDELSGRNAKMKIVLYIMHKRNRTTNELRQTVVQIAEGAGVCRRVVIQTLQVLEKHNIIRRRLRADAKAISSYIFLNPDVLMAGSHGKHKALLVRFQQLELPIANHDKVISINQQRSA